MQVERRIHVPFFFGPFNRTCTSVMAQSIQTARIPTPGHLSGICLFFKKICCNCSMVGPAHLYKSPRWGLGKGANTLYPTHGTRSKFDLMIQAKNILIGSSGFLEHYFVCNYNCNALQDRSQKVGF